MKLKFPRFQGCMKMMRKRNPQTQEDGFHWLLPHANEHVHELIAEFKVENDIGLRCWLLELIGAAKSPDACGLLAEQLRSDNESLRQWAIIGLKALNTKEARTLLREA